MLVAFSNILKFIISHIFGFIVNLRNYLFDINFIKSISVNNHTNDSGLERKHIVISIGNISVGGSGKTPLTIFIANELSKLSYKIAVVGRGYGRKNTDNVKIIRNIIESNQLIKSDNIGDEMVEIALNTNADIFIGSKKYEMAKIASETQLNDVNKYDYIIVDDGFQHRKLRRDFDIVIIDKNTLENENLMPLGRLREKYGSIKRANYVIFRNIEVQNLTQKQLSKYNKILSIIKSNNIKSKTIQSSHFNYSLGKLFDYNNNEIENVNSNLQSKTQVNLITAIANPEVFKSDISNTGIEIVNSYIYPDHYNFTNEDVKQIIENSDLNSLFITTEKDFTKINSILENLQENLEENLKHNLKNRFLYFKLEIKSNKETASLIEEIVKLKSI